MDKIDGSAYGTFMLGVQSNLARGGQAVSHERAMSYDAGNSKSLISFMDLEMHRFKDRLAKGQLCRIFCVGRLVHPAVFDIHGMVGGYHGFWIDQEHVGVTYEQVVLATSAGRANGMDCFVRMPMTNYADATANLEAGSGGLMAARIESAKHAEEFMQWVKFAPRGNRGLNASGYDCLYGGKTLPQLAQEANRDNFVAIQIETLGALEECEKIAAIEGVDLLFVGPS